MGMSHDDINETAAAILDALESPIRGVSPVEVNNREHALRLIACGLMAVLGMNIKVQAKGGAE